MEPTGSLTTAERETLTAIYERMFPSDDLGPGAREIGVIDYVVGALAGAYAELVPKYQAGLARLDDVARRDYGDAYVALDEAEQDAIIERLEKGELAELEAAPTEGFFALLWQHMREGLFCDPIHGGNHGMLGWKLIGFPGAQYGYSAEEQQIDYAINREPRSLADLLGPANQN